VFFLDGVAVGSWRLAVGNGENLTAIDNGEKQPRVADGWDWPVVWVLAVSLPTANRQLPTANFKELEMIYDEDLLVELIAGGDVSQTEIAERVGVSRRTVWRIANGHSRPDLQQKITDTVEGYRQAAIRLAAKFMKPLLKKEIEVALEGDGEISRRCREFLLKTFMIVLPEQAAKHKPRPAGDKPRDPIAPEMNLMELSPDLKDQVVKELGGPTDERFSATEYTESTEVEKAKPSDDPVTDPPTGKKIPDPFAAWVDGPHGKKVYAHAIRAIEEAKADEAARPTRRRVPRVPRE